MREERREKRERTEYTLNCKITNRTKTELDNRRSTSKSIEAGDNHRDIKSAIQGNAKASGMHVHLYTRLQVHVHVQVRQFDRSRSTSYAND